MSIKKRTIPIASLPVVDQEQFHQRLYELISKIVSAKMRGKRKMELPHAKLLYGVVTEVLFRYVAQSGYYRFPKGWGSFKLQAGGPMRKRLPTGTIVQIDERIGLRFNEGAALRELLGKPDKHVERRKPRKSLLKQLGLGGV